MHGAHAVVWRRLPALQQMMHMPSTLERAVTFQYVLMTAQDIH